MHSMGIDGLQPDKLSTNVLRLYEGHCCNATGTRQVVNPGAYDIDMLVNGVGGLDTGSPASGQNYHVYVLRDAFTGAFGAMLSAALFYGDVVVPFGWEMVRKLRFGFVWSTAWDGIPNFHVAHWPHPHVRLTDSELSSKWMPLGNAQATDWALADLSRFMPDNARVAHLMVQTRFISDTAGSAYLRSHGGQSTGILVGSVSPGSPFAGPTYVTIRVDSHRKIGYKTTGGAGLWVQFLGYDMTEPS